MSEYYYNTYKELLKIVCDKLILFENTYCMLYETEEYMCYLALYKLRSNILMDFFLFLRIFVFNKKMQYKRFFFMSTHCLFDYSCRTSHTFLYLIACMNQQCVARLKLVQMESFDLQRPYLTII